MPGRFHSTAQSDPHSYWDNDGIAQSARNDLLYLVRRVSSWIGGVLLVVGFGWLMHLGALAVSRALFDDHMGDEGLVVFAILIDAVLLIVLLRLFLRWLRTQPNPVDS